MEANQRYIDEKNAVGITREIEGAIELSDEHGGEKAILAEAKGLRKGQIQNVALAILGGLVTIAAAVYEIVAKGALAGALPRVGVGVLGALGLAAAIAMTVFFFKNKSSLQVILNRFSTSTLADLIAKIGVIGENRAKRDGMIASTESARLALEAAKAKYEKADDRNNSLTWKALNPKYKVIIFSLNIFKKIR